MTKSALTAVTAVSRLRKITLPYCRYMEGPCSYALDTKSRGQYKVLKYGKTCGSPVLDISLAEEALQFDLAITILR